MIGPSVIGERPRPLSVFVSWAHSAHDWSEARSESWEKTVVEFTGSLRLHGVAADVDLYHVHADVDWTRFGPSRIADSEVTIIVVSSAWRERWEGSNATNVGAGAAQEADELHGLFQRDQEAFQKKAKIVILPGASEGDIPNDLRRLPRYHVHTFNSAGLEKLLRALFSKPLYVPPPLGVTPDFPPLNVISDSSGRTRTCATASDGLVQPSNPAAQGAKLRADLEQAEDTLRALSAPHPGEGPQRWYRRAWETAQQHRASILGSLAALNAATGTPVVQASASEQTRETPAMVDTKGTTVVLTTPAGLRWGENRYEDVEDWLAAPLEAGNAPNSYRYPLNGQVHPPREGVVKINIDTNKRYDQGEFPVFFNGTFFAQVYLHESRPPLALHLRCVWSDGTESQHSLTIH